MATKKERELLFQKYNGHCAYCGCELTKGWHVDEVEPIRRNRRYDRKKRKWVADGCRHPERLHLANQMPACASCNINKHTMTLEEFRALIGGFIRSLNQYSVQYKVAKRYGLLQEIQQPILFYFERIALLDEHSGRHETNAGYRHAERQTVCIESHDRAVAGMGNDEPD